jgi:hypothetical protein
VLLGERNLRVVGCQAQVLLDGAIHDDRQTSGRGRYGQPDGNRARDNRRPRWRIRCVTHALSLASLGATSTATEQLDGSQPARDRSNF